MSDKNHRRIIHKANHGKVYKIVEFLVGIIMLVIGTLMSLDISFREKTKKEIEMTPYIAIANESDWAGINVSCYVKNGGEIILGVKNGPQMDKAVRVWIFIINIGKPFNWEVSEGVEQVILTDSVSDGKSFLEQYIVSPYFAISRTYTSQKTDDLQGMSREYKYRECTMFNGEVFTTMIEPKGESRYIHFQMDIEDVEYLQEGDIVINMPRIFPMRNAPVYHMDTGDFLELAQLGDASWEFWNCQIDGKPILDTHLYVHGTYEGDYCNKSDYVLRKVVPTPEFVEPIILWEEENQWAPELVFHEYAYDKTVTRKSWLGGVLIAFGSGLVVLPLSEWLKKL